MLRRNVAARGQRAASFILLGAIAFGFSSCRNSPWFLSGSTAGAVFVGTRPEGEQVKATIRSSRAPLFAMVTLTPDSPDGGVFPIEPPIDVRLAPGPFTGAPVTMRDTTASTMLLRNTGTTSCGPCSLDIDMALTRTGDAGMPPIGVTWRFFTTISGEEQETPPPEESVTVVPR